MAFDALIIDPDQEAALIRLENLGRYVSSDSRAIFKEAISRVTLSGVIDITNWTRDAIYTLIEFLNEAQASVSLRKGSRCFTPVLLPKGELLDSFVDAIVSDEL